MAARRSFWRPLARLRSTPLDILGGAIDDPAFYASMISKPNGLDMVVRIEPAVFWSSEMGEFILPYDALRAAANPAVALLSLLQRTYAASADLAGTRTGSRSRRSTGPNELNHRG